MESRSNSSSSAASILVASTAAAVASGLAVAGLYSLRASREARRGEQSSSSSEKACDDHVGCSWRRHSVTVTLPDWARNTDHFSRTYRTDEEMMDVAVRLSARNVAEGTGGPFGSAVFERDLATGDATLVSIGVNRVVPLGNSTLHGETVAIQMAQSRIGSYTLGRRSSSFCCSDGDDDDEEEKKECGDAGGGGGGCVAVGVQFELFTSCEPCAMCLGATLWSGVSRIVCAARKEDAAAIGFDEGPVFEQSYDHLRGAGIEVVRGVLQKEAAEVLANYGKYGVIYNG